MSLIDEAQKGVLEEVAKTAAKEVVDAQAPNRKMEHESIALRIIKFTLWLTIFEAAIVALAVLFVHNDADNRIQCLSNSFQALVYEHIGEDGFDPPPACK